MKVVLDAGILVSLFVPQPASDACIAFVNDALGLADAGLPPSAGGLRAPDCIFYEVAATLRKYERLGAYREMEADLLRLHDLPITATSCKDLMLSASQISRAHVVSPYDAFYLALSQRDGLPLVTVDSRLANGVKGKGYDVRLVGAM
jgi:predicted nucleic acid-binding protein